MKDSFVVRAIFFLIIQQNFTIKNKTLQAFEKGRSSQNEKEKRIGIG